MHLSPMVNFEELLGRSRFEALRESAHDSDHRLARLEEIISEQKREIEELKSESLIAAAFRLEMHDRLQHAKES